MLHEYFKFVLYAKIQTNQPAAKASHRSLNTSEASLGRPTPRRDAFVKVTEKGVSMDDDPD